MKGQWIGKYNGDVEGKIMINIDEVEDHYEAVAYVNPNKKEFPISVAYLSTLDKRPVQNAVAYINPVDPKTGHQCKWEDIKDLYPEDVSHSEQSNVSFKLEGSKLHLDSTSNIGAKLSSTLTKPAEDNKSKIVGEEISWSEFKSRVSQYLNNKYLYRGQKETWRLRTSFHRGDRYRISKFIDTDVKQLHKKLSSITPHYFDLNIPEQNGSFINLIQHHGYPTPLLDWTYSPYVSAFFAFRDWPIGCSANKFSRIYVFNNSEWQKNYPQNQNIDPPHPHLSVMDFIAINNPRLVPQQAVTTVTNIDDIEAYVLEREKESSKEYLKAFDISAKERDIAMIDLRFMGITAGSMFPSIAGICEDHKERNFDK